MHELVCLQTGYFIYIFLWFLSVSFSRRPYRFLLQKSLLGSHYLVSCVIFILKWRYVTSEFLEDNCVISSFWKGGRMCDVRDNREALRDHPVDDSKKKYKSTACTKNSKDLLHVQ